jgi:hypothetical protein
MTEREDDKGNPLPDDPTEERLNLVMHQLSVIAKQQRDHIRLLGRLLVVLGDDSDFAKGAMHGVMLNTPTYVNPRRRNPFPIEEG